MLTRTITAWGAKSAPISSRTSPKESTEREYGSMRPTPHRVRTTEPIRTTRFDRNASRARPYPHTGGVGTRGVIIGDHREPFVRPARRAIPALAPFANDVFDALRRAGDQLVRPAARTGDEARMGDGTLTGDGTRSLLRHRYEQVAAALAGRAGSGPLLTVSDELVDVVNTLSDLFESTAVAPQA